MSGLQELTADTGSHAEIFVRRDVDGGGVELDAAIDIGALYLSLLTANTLEIFNSKIFINVYLVIKGL